MIDISKSANDQATRAVKDVPPAIDTRYTERLESTLDTAQQLIDEASVETTCALSIVLPVYNERKTIRQVVQRVAALPIQKEIIIVDDGSTDGTSEIVDQLAEMSEVVVVHHDRNRGKGAALQSGFARAIGDVVVVQDADLEYDPADIVMLIKPIMANRCDVVYGSRYLAPVSTDGWLHRTGNRLLTALSNFFTGQSLTDMETCYKVIRRSALQKITLRQNGFGIEPELTAKLSRGGRRIYEMPISYQSRGYADGKKIGFRDALKAVWCIVRYRIAD